MRIPITRMFRAAFLTLIAFTAGQARAAINDYMVFKLNDGKAVEGKVAVEDLAKYVVEYQSRGITKQETVYRHTIADFHILTAAELEQRAKATAAQTGAASPVGGPVFPTVMQAAPFAQAGGAPAPAAQQAKQLLAQGRFGEAVQFLEQSIGSSGDTNETIEPRQLLKDAYTSWFDSLQKSKQQASYQLAIASNRVAQVETNLQTLQKALDARRQEELRRKTRSKQVADTGAQAAINSLQLEIMTVTRELNQRMPEVPRYQRQIAAIDQQIAFIQPRVVTLNQFQIMKAQFGSQDVTTIIQKMIKDDSLTVCATPEAFGLSQDRFRNQNLRISYIMGNQTNAVTVDPAWTVVLPALKLTPPTFAVLQAQYGFDDVTAFVQNMVKDSSLTICIRPELFGLAQQRAGDGKFRITYAIGPDKKTITVLSGWTLALPVLKLIPPETAPVETSASPTQLQIKRALFDRQDVTVFLQKLVTDNSLTVRAMPELFGLSGKSIQDGRLFITYTLGKEEKSVTVESDWTIHLPSLTLTAPEVPWYREHWAWLLGGLFVLWILFRSIRVSV